MSLPFGILHLAFVAGALAPLGSVHKQGATQLHRQSLYGMVRHVLVKTRECTGNRLAVSRCVPAPKQDMPC